MPAIALKLGRRPHTHSPASEQAEETTPRAGHTGAPGSASRKRRSPPGTPAAAAGARWPPPPRHCALFAYAPTAAELEHFFGAEEAEAATSFTAKWGFDVRSGRPIDTPARPSASGWSWSRVDNDGSS